MAYFAVNKNGVEKIFHGRCKPHRVNEHWEQFVGPCIWIDEGLTLPRNYILAYTGKKASWSDEPIRV